jgi:hypothetical protein
MQEKFKSNQSSKNLESLKSHHKGIVSSGKELIYLGESGGFSQMVDVEDFIHGVLVGETNSGKTNYLSQLISTTHFMNQKTGSTWYILSSKHHGAKDYEGVAKLIESEIRVEGTSNFDAVMTELYAEYQLRRELFKNCGVRDISDYRAKAGPLKRQYLVIDEWPEVYTEDENSFLTEGTPFNLFYKLLTGGRAFGFTIILTAQRYNRMKFPSAISRNLPTTLVKRSDSSTKEILGLDPNEVLQRHEVLFKYTDYETAKLTVSKFKEAVLDDFPVVKLRHVPGPLKSNTSLYETIKGFVDRLFNKSKS